MVREAYMLVWGDNKSINKEIKYRYYQTASMSTSESADAEVTVPVVQD